MIRIFAHFLRRMTRDHGLLAQSGGFFALAMMICVFAIGSQEVLLAAVLPSLAWAVLLLASLLGLADLMSADELDDLLLSPRPMPALMAAKMIAHWTATGLPIALIAPLVLLLFVPGGNLSLPCMWLGLALGSLTFSALGLLGAALTLDSRRNAALQALIIMPLCVPALIFGAGSVTAQQLDMGWQAPLAFLAAIACASLTLAPFAAAWIIRMKVTSS